MDDALLHQRLGEELNQQRALLQGAAGAAIAFSLHQTANARLDWALLPTVFAVIAWAISFASGIFNSHAKQAAIRFNIAWNELERNDQFGEANDLKTEFQTFNHRAQKTYRIQLWSLLFGAVLYFAGHGLQIIENANSLHRAITSLG